MKIVVEEDVYTVKLTMTRDETRALHRIMVIAKQNGATGLEDKIAVDVAVALVNALADSEG